MKKFNVFFLAIIAIMLTSCSMVPTSYTTDTVQKNIARTNTLLQMELVERYLTMDAKILKEFLRNNLMYAILIENILCGNLSEAVKMYQDNLNKGG